MDVPVLHRPATKALKASASRAGRKDSCKPKPVSSWPRKSSDTEIEFPPILWAASDDEDSAESPEKSCGPSKLSLCEDIRRGLYPRIGRKRGIEETQTARQPTLRRSKALRQELSNLVDEALVLAKPRQPRPPLQGVPDDFLSDFSDRLRVSSVKLEPRSRRPDVSDVLGTALALPSLDLSVLENRGCGCGFCSAAVTSSVGLGSHPRAQAGNRIGA